MRRAGGFTGKNRKPSQNVFALGGRGINKHLVVNAESDCLVDTNLDKDDLAANICPVGVILHKGRGFAVPIGERIYDKEPISTLDLAAAEEGHS